MSTINDIVRLRQAFKAAIQEEAKLKSEFETLYDALDEATRRWSTSKNDAALAKVDLENAAINLECP